MKRAWIVCIVSVGIGFIGSTLIGCSATARSKDQGAIQVTNERQGAGSNGPIVPLQVKAVDLEKGIQVINPPDPSSPNKRTALLVDANVLGMKWQYANYQYPNVPGNDHGQVTNFRQWLNELGKQSWEPCFQFENADNLKKENEYTFRSRYQ